MKKLLNSPFPIITMILALICGAIQVSYIYYGFNFFVFLAGLIIGFFATLFALWEPTYDDRITLKGVSIIAIIVIFLVIFGFVIFTVRTVQTPNSERITALYSVTAPFGYLWTETTGQISGGFLHISGYIGSDLQEAYIVKFMVGNELHTITIDAATTPLIVDGEFYLEKILTYSEQQFTFLNGYTVYIGKDPDPILSYKLHIPQLPEINQTLTVNYGVP